MCENFGWLSHKQEEVNNLDKLGKAVSIYFKLLKSLIVLFILFAFMSIPLYIIYSAGEVNMSQPFHTFSQLSLGNLG